MTQHYIGFTMGPVFETIQEASKPASMWFASAFFSELTRQLCLGMMAKDKTTNIFSPYIDDISEAFGNDELAAIPQNWDGIGKYNDRILCQTSLSKAELDKLIVTVKKKMANYFGFTEEKDRAIAEDFLVHYLQVSYVILEEKDVPVGANIAKTLNDYLDYLELLPTFKSTNEGNPFRKLFVTNDINPDKYSRGHNHSVKESNLYKGVDSEKSQLSQPDVKGAGKKKNRKIKDIKDIINAPEGSDSKHWKYFAIVNSDGDRMGKLLEELCKGQNSDKQVDLVKEFSKACLEYTQEAAKLVGDYGGFTIYAGGDDLLFLAPLISSSIKVKNIFELIAELNKLFFEKINEAESLKGIVGEMDDKPSLSYGISINYYKFPLYEAFNEARYLLEDAKKTRNCASLRLTKHSGGVLSLNVPNSFIQKPDNKNTISFLTCLDLPDNFTDCQKSDTQNTTSACSDEPKSDQIELKASTIHSIVYHLENCHAIFEQLTALRDELEQEAFVLRFMNNFDNSDQAVFSDVIEKLATFYYQQLDKGGLFARKDTEKEKEKDAETEKDELKAFTQFLRFKKFFVEKAEKDEKSGEEKKGGENE